MNYEWVTKLFCPKCGREVTLREYTDTPHYVLKFKFTCWCSSKTK
jgi:hypothetical protein